MASPSDLAVQPQWTSTIEEIANLHGVATGHAKEAILAGIQIGEILTRVKGALKHGQWLPWLAGLPFSQPMAWYYVAAYERRDEIRAKLLAGNNFNYKLLLDSEKNGEHAPQQLHESNFESNSIRLTQRLMGDFNHEIKDHPLETWERNRLINLGAATAPIAELHQRIRSLIA